MGGIMSSLIVSGDTSGSITLSAPAVAGSSVLTLPASTDTLVGKATTDTLTNKTLTAPVLSGSVTGTYTLGGTPTAGASLITSGTAVASTSGTSIDFTGIPSWAKRITVMLNGVSTNGTSNPLFQIGSGSVATTGYLSSNALANSGTTAVGTNTNGFGTQFGSAANALCGTLVIYSFGSNIYVASYSLSSSNSGSGQLGSGGITLGGALDRVRITTSNGTDTFDAGSINILYE